MTKAQPTSTNISEDGNGCDPLSDSILVLPSRLPSTSHTSLVKWRRERRKYEANVRNRAQGGTDDKIVPIKMTFDERVPDVNSKMREILRMDLTGSDISK
ncbi:hypothetical protein L915_20610 [Phytophthora nicotianae]|uniref:Uncharacterized protein n=1 Tax=Phytophthora nicotianae TaxID=4792 RepID=W2FN87_PHYNI|nr:hypothetical protein L915_20610 [Phytophthora nicotianae]